MQSHQMPTAQVARFHMFSSRFKTHKMVKYLLQKCLLSFFFLASFTGYSQTVKWPTITQVNKPWSRWWWEGSAVNKKQT